MARKYTRIETQTHTQRDRYGMLVNNNNLKIGLKGWRDMRQYTTQYAVHARS